MANPLNISRPRLKGPLALIAWAVVSLAAIGTLTAGVVYVAKRYKADDEPVKRAVLVTQGLDPALFDRTKDPEPKPEPKSEPRPVKPAEIPPPPPPPRRLTSEQIFRPRPPAPQDLAREINSQRRGAVGVSAPLASASGRMSFEKWQKANSQQKWNEERSDATLPVDMSRVVNVAKHIPALLENEINSELPGKVVATIEENVYGSKGRLVLIPAGSKAVGRYRPLGKIGERRIQIIWERIITYPDGINIHTENAEMADAMGRAGITGDLDNRFMERYGLALFVSVMGAVAQTQIPADNRAQGIAIESIGNSGTSLAKTILEKNIDLKPIVTIPQASRIYIEANKDIWFKPPVDGKIEAVALH